MNKTITSRDGVLLSICVKVLSSIYIFLYRHFESYESFSYQGTGRKMLLKISSKYVWDFSSRVLRKKTNLYLMGTEQR